MFYNNGNQYYVVSSLTVFCQVTFRKLSLSPSRCAMWRCGATVDCIMWNTGCNAEKRCHGSLLHYSCSRQRTTRWSLKKNSSIPSTHDSIRLSCMRTIENSGPPLDNKLVKPSPFLQQIKLQGRLDVVIILLLNSVSDVWSVVWACIRAFPATAEFNEWTPSVFFSLYILLPEDRKYNLKKKRILLILLLVGCS